jgi:hypothetical protein
VVAVAIDLTPPLDLREVMARRIKSAPEACYIARKNDPDDDAA